LDINNNINQGAKIKTKELFNKKLLNAYLHLHKQQIY